jgi:NADH-quinone oxidoreductase subunit D
MARSVGIKRDVRLSKIHSYSNYNIINFKSYLGLNGDSYDRYLIRMFEMGESLNICNYVIENLLKLKSNHSIRYQQLINKELKYHYKNYTYMEDLIEHFLQ